METLAESDPHKFISALQSISKMAGYSDKTETSIDVTHNFRVLSDSQLEDRLGQLAEQLGIPKAKLLGPSMAQLDLEATDISEPELAQRATEDSQDVS